MASTNRRVQSYRSWILRGSVGEKLFSNDLLFRQPLATAKANNNTKKLQLPTSRNWHSATDRSLKTNLVFFGGKGGGRSTTSQGMTSCYCLIALRSLLLRSQSVHCLDPEIDGLLICIMASLRFCKGGACCKCKKKDDMSIILSIVSKSNDISVITSIVIVLLSLFLWLSFSLFFPLFLSIYTYFSHHFFSSFSQ